MELNVVIHRLNIDHVEEILAMAERMGAGYVELANTQYYGWAWLNRARLLPSREHPRLFRDHRAPRGGDWNSSVSISACAAALYRGPLTVH